jgi:hypothetical protein
MNKALQILLLLLLPFYPLWAALIYTLAERNIDIFSILLFIPIAIYLLFSKKVKLPAYLIFYIIFTIYHLGSVLYNNIIPSDKSVLYTILTDINLLGCIILFVVENVKFDDKVISRMNLFILIAVGISLVFSVIQVRDPYFFVSPVLTRSLEGIFYLEQHRNFSIYSWVNINSLGITFPILISILISQTGEINLKKWLPVILISAILVAFLSRARYIMISAVIVLSQLFFVAKIELKRKIYILLLFIGSITLLLVLANVYGFDIQRVVSERILEERTGLGSFKARVTSFEVFKLKFPEHPVFGVGPQTRADVVELLGGVAPLIHIGYLSYLYFYGLAGCIFLFLALFFLVKRAWDTGRKHAFWGSFYGLLAFLFANLTFVYFNFSEAGMVLAILYMKYYSEKNPEEKQATKLSLKTQENPEVELPNL